MTADTVQSPDFASVQGFGVSRESFDRLRAYHALLLKWQKAINLVSPSTLPQAWSRHFVDSVQVLPLLPAHVRSCVDLGSGGGFPGLIIAACRPDIDVHLVDSDMRKCQFLKTVSRESGMSNVHVHNERVEAVLARQDFDLVTARGFASLSAVLDIILSCGRDVAKGECLLMKGERFADEVEEAQALCHFDYEDRPSITESAARILRVFNVRKF